MEKLVSDLGNIIRDYRQGAGLTQQELADKMGTSQSSIARMECGRYNPTIQWLTRCFSALSVEFHITLDDPNSYDLLGDNENDN